ncbi:hypothetical protein ACNKHT_14880 [Shigella flexneri]
MKTSTLKSRLVVVFYCYTRRNAESGRAAPESAQSEQCLNNMPEGPFKADYPLTTPPPKEAHAAHHESLITHFLQVSWGLVMPANEAVQMIQATKGIAVTT